MIRNTYMANYHNKLYMKIMIDGKPVVCEFKNASRLNKNLKGVFSTSNPKIIKALEARSDFNLYFRLIESVNDEKAVIDEPVFKSPDIEPPKEEEPEAKKDEGKPKKEEVRKEEIEVKEQVDENIKPEQKTISVPADEVQIVQQAKEWMKKKYPDLTARQLGSKAKILETAKELGVVFEALE